MPILQPFNGSNERSVVVTDNASIHHVHQMATLIQATGAILRFLPSYSPDFNPLEESFAKLKAFIKCYNVSSVTSCNGIQHHYSTRLSRIY